MACSRTRAGALPTDRPIRDARVPQAIGQSFDWLVPAEAEVVGARAADRPAAFPPAELTRRQLAPGGGYGANVCGSQTNGKV